MNLNKPLESPGGESQPNILADLRSSGEPVAGIPDLGAAPKPRRKIDVQTLIVALTVTASAACLWMMRQQGKGAGFTFQTVKIDIEPEQAARNADHARILSDLVRSTHAPIAVEKLDKNPFKLATPEVVPEPTQRAQGPAVDHEAEEIKRILAGIHVNAIMQGRIPIARINNNLVKVGDTFEGKLIVAQINDRSVEFIAAGKRYTVNMAEGGGQPRPGFPPRYPGQR